MFPISVIKRARTYNGKIIKLTPKRKKGDGKNQGDFVLLERFFLRGCEMDNSIEYEVIIQLFLNGVEDGKKNNIKNALSLFKEYTKGEYFNVLWYGKHNDPEYVENTREFYAAVLNVIYYRDPKLVKLTKEEMLIFNRSILGLFLRELCLDLYWKHDKELKLGFKEDRIYDLLYVKGKKNNQHFYEKAIYNIFLEVFNTASLIIEDHNIDLGKELISSGTLQSIERYTAKIFAALLFFKVPIHDFIMNERAFEIIDKFEREHNIDPRIPMEIKVIPDIFKGNPLEKRKDKQKIENYKKIYRYKVIFDEILPEHNISEKSICEKMGIKEKTYNKYKNDKKNKDKLIRPIEGTEIWDNDLKEIQKLFPRIRLKE